MSVYVRGNYAVEINRPRYAVGIFVDCNDKFALAYKVVFLDPSQLSGHGECAVIVVGKSVITVSDNPLSPT